MKTNPLLPQVKQYWLQIHVWDSLVLFATLMFAIVMAKKAAPSTVCNVQHCFPDYYCRENKT